MSDADRVRAYYAGFADREGERLESAEGRLEFAVTTALLERHLPADGRVLDLGGGPGRYAGWLSDRGYAVTLADLSPELVRLAGERIDLDGLVEARVADARDLSVWPDGRFDAVVCLGPFYHLPDPADRSAAAAEIVRVLAPGGVAVVAYMTRVSLIRRTLAIPDERSRFADRAAMERLSASGRFDAPAPGRFDVGYGEDPAEIVPFWSGQGLVDGIVVSTKGLAHGLEEAYQDLAETDSDAAATAFDLILDSTGDPSLIGFGPHILYVGRRAGTAPH